MKFGYLSAQWKRIFELEWQSLCEGSKAIAVVIADENGNIISEGRNMISECVIPNPATAHAETEAIRNLDISKYPDKKKYTLYAGLEPCVMCMGTLVMGGIRKVEIAARDDYGGAMALMEHSDYIRGKGIRITWLDNELGDIQRAFQTIRELLYNEDKEKLQRMLADFSVYNKAGVKAAKNLVDSGIFKNKKPADFTAEEIFDTLIKSIIV